MCLQIHQFTQQITLNSLNFTAAGFFSIDNSLTGKVCYLLIYFKKSNKILKNEIKLCYLFILNVCVRACVRVCVIVFLI